MDRSSPSHTNKKSLCFNYSMHNHPAFGLCGIGKSSSFTDIEWEAGQGGRSWKDNSMRGVSMEEMAYAKQGEDRGDVID